MCRLQGQRPDSEKRGKEKGRNGRSGEGERVRGEGKEGDIKGVMEEGRDRIRRGKEQERMVVGRGSLYLWFKRKRIISPIGTGVLNLTGFEGNTTCAIFCDLWVRPACP